VRITKKHPMYIAVQLMNTDTRRCVWLPLPATKDEFAAALNRIGVKNGNFQIVDYNRRVPGVTIDTLMCAPLCAVNHFASRLNRLTDADLLKLCAIGDSNYYFGMIWQLIEYTYKPDNYTLLPGICDEESLGRYYLGNEHAAVHGAKLRQCIDRYEYGKRLAEMESGAFTALGYITSKDKWSSKRKPRPVPDSLNLRGYLNEDLYGDWDDCEW